MCYFIIISYFALTFFFNYDCSNYRVNNGNDISPFEGIRADEFGNSSILSYIKNYLIKDEDNIDAFFKIPGSLHALVGQFTGNPD